MPRAAAPCALFRSGSVKLERFGNLKPPSTDARSNVGARPCAFAQLGRSQHKNTRNRELPNRPTFTARRRFPRHRPETESRKQPQARRIELEARAECTGNHRRQTIRSHVGRITNRVGGASLVGAPSSHTTVRTVRYTAVPSFDTVLADNAWKS